MGENKRDFEMKSDTSPRLGDYEVHRAWEGFSSIRQTSSGEIMHSRTDPTKEARQLYVEQSRLEDRLQEPSPTDEPLIVWDVGLGAAANALAAIECYEKCSAARRMRLVSFENDLNSLRLALATRESFPYLRVDAASAIVTDGAWRSISHPRLTWELLPGDFLETMNRAPAPEVIFYDMFSTKTSTRLWATRTFRKIFEVCADRAVELFTYTCSTANRAAFLAAGFFVARGRNAGDKIETTIAMTAAAVRAPFRQRTDLLSVDW